MQAAEDPLEFHGKQREFGLAGSLYRVCVQPAGVERAKLRDLFDLFPGGIM